MDRIDDISNAEHNAAQDAIYNMFEAAKEYGLFVEVTYAMVRFVQDGMSIVDACHQALVYWDL